ncbi:fatty acid cis/trans isomerase, partial [Oligoflexaceae bacterium]|nr:fatty acid cis/trans isomerase [Oligoflexaceae bacterium]
MRKISPFLYMFLILMATSLFADQDASLWRSAKDVLNKRCVSCHACYSSPCQVDLSSYEGISRGSHKDNVYDGLRLIETKPTRLFIDASSSATWQRKFGFFPIVNKKGADAILLDSVLTGQRRASNYTDLKFDTKSGLFCPNPSQSQSVNKSHPERGMPFGLPALDTKEINILRKWASAGYPGTDGNESELLQNIPKTLKAAVSKFERYLNSTKIQDQIVSRYLYEHLFLAHIYFTGFDRKFYRLVRSSTPAPKPIAEMSTVRPFDPPTAKKVYYRLRPIVSELVHKNHIVFEVNSEILEKWNETLNKGKWIESPKTMPSYDKAQASNPFRTFKDMPLEGRYKFFLENARYFAMTFIRGPVCEGQIAVNVIRDHFFSFFIDPKFDLSITDPEFLIKAAPLLDLPAKGESSPFESYYKKFKEQQMKYLAFRAEQYQKKRLRGDTKKAIWDGDGNDRDAALTIFRHFDNSSVIKGMWGGTAETVWIMDYPIFERMYYLLASGFNVFGNVFHQSSTRLYMDSLRVEAENNY